MTRRLTITRDRSDLLFIVATHGPVSVRDTAHHLNVDGSWARSRLYTLSLHGLIDRQYTGIDSDSEFGYVITDAGRQAIPDDADDPEEM